jgi:uncharacterized protein (DUF433 family)/DNA-binding transcriptional MerR regulator
MEKKFTLEGAGGQAHGLAPTNLGSDRAIGSRSRRKNAGVGRAISANLDRVAQAAGRGPTTSAAPNDRGDQACELSYPAHHCHARRVDAPDPAVRPRLRGAFDVGVRSAALSPSRLLVHGLIGSSNDLVGVSAKSASSRLPRPSNSCVILQNFAGPRRSGGSLSNVIAAFSEEHVERLTGVTKGQLKYWHRTNFFSPTFAGAEWEADLGRVYSFADVVALRVLNILRNRHGVPLPHLRDVSIKLAGLSHEKWTHTTLYVVKNRVVWNSPASNRPEEITSGQRVVECLDLGAVVFDTQRDVLSLGKRSRKQLGRVEKSRQINHNDAVIAGTRIRVRAIKRFSEAGYTVKQILAEYPDLTEKDVQAAINYGEIRAAA